MIQHPCCRTPPRQGEIGCFCRGIIDCKAGELMIFFRGPNPIIKSLQGRMINNLGSLAFKESLRLTKLTWRSLDNGS